MTLNHRGVHWVSFGKRARCISLKTSVAILEELLGPGFNDVNLIRDD